jgi:hypothetical protein
VNGELKTPEEWEKTTGITVRDADGWSDGTWLDPITESDFHRRVADSTIEMRTK